MKQAVYVCVAAVLLGHVAGCVSPGVLDSALVARYQREMAHRGPQRRGGTDGLASLRPIGKLPDLTVEKPAKDQAPRVRLSLAEAVRRHLAASPEIRVVSYDPAISWEDVEQAAAAFDYTVFGGMSWAKSDERTTNPVFPSRSSSRVFNIGVRKRTTLGTTAELAYTWTRAWSNSTFQALSTYHEPTIGLEIAQPLLRDFGPDVNLAELRIGRLNYKGSVARFRQQVEALVAKVVTTYWQLANARRVVEIQKQLLDRTRHTLDRIRKRGGLDATAVQIKQAEASVESRRADLIRAEKGVLDAQQELARLLADRQLALLADLEIIPTTEAVSSPVKINTTDQLVLALRRSPLLEEARLAIRAAEINVTVAHNQRLPRLDLQAGALYQGLGPTSRFGHDELLTGNYYSYNIGVQLEYPLGNRAARAALRQSRLERLKAVTNLQNLSDQVAVSVAERIRQLKTTYEEVQAQRSAVAAAKVELRALDDIEELRGRLTPEFLTTKLSSQERLAAAERQEFQALVDYNVALIELAQTTGVLLEKYDVAVEDIVAGYGATARARRRLPRPRH